MFFDASPAGAQEEFPGWFRTPSEEDLKKVAKDLYGTADLSKLDEDERFRLEVEFYARLKEDYDEIEAKADQSLDSLQSGGCAFNGICQ